MADAVNARYARYVGRVGALAVALGVGFVLGNGIAWADETGGRTSSDSASSTASSQTGHSAAGGADSAGGKSTEKRDPGPRKPGAPTRSAGTSTSTGTKDAPTGNTTGNTTDAKVDAPQSEPAESINRHGSDSINRRGSDSDPAGAASRQRSTLGIPLDAADHRAAFNGSRSTAVKAAVAGDAAPVAKTPTEAATATSQGVASTDTAPKAAVDVATTEAIAKVPQMVAAPATGPQDAVIDVESGVLGGMGMSPLVTDDPVPAAPPSPSDLMALQFTRREVQQTALAGIPAVAPITTSLTVDQGAAAPMALALAAPAASDSTADLQAKFNALRSGDTLILDAGTFNYSSSLYIRTSNVSVIGNGTTLNSTNPASAALIIQASNVNLSNLNLTGPVGLPRVDSTYRTRLVFGADGVHISDVTITGGTSAGVYITGGSNFLMERVTVQDTGADGVQITNGSNNGILNDITTLRTGDDGIAIVSYQFPWYGTVHDITVNNPIVSGGGQRGLVVVGGQGITFNNINVSDTALAGVFVGSQGLFFTQATDGVHVNGGTVTRGGIGGLPGGSVSIWSTNRGQTVSNVLIENLTLVDTPESAFTNVGIWADVWRGAPVSNVVFQNIDIVQARPVFALPFFVVGAAAETYSATGFTINGVAIGDPPPIPPEIPEPPERLFGTAVIAVSHAIDQRVQRHLEHLGADQRRHRHRSRIHQRRP